MLRKLKSIYLVLYISMSFTACYIHNTFMHHLLSRKDNTIASFSSLRIHNHNYYRTTDVHFTKHNNNNVHFTKHNNNARSKITTAFMSIHDIDTLSTVVMLPSINSILLSTTNVHNIIDIGAHE